MGLTDFFKGQKKKYEERREIDRQIEMARQEAYDSRRMTEAKKYGRHQATQEYREKRTRSPPSIDGALGDFGRQLTGDYLDAPKRATRPRRRTPTRAQVVYIQAPPARIPPRRRRNTKRKDDYSFLGL